MSIPNSVRKIIVNADDFGMSEEANKAIVQAFQQNVISSTTVMTNMPGFAEACDLAHQYGLVGKVGVHLNLTSGYPLSEPIRRCPRLCDDTGRFRARQTLIWLSSKEKSAIKTELDAQVKACLDRELCPTHLDSHHHVHTEWPIGTIVIAVARKYGIKAIRLSRNCGHSIGPVHRFYKWAYNARLKAYGLGKTKYFGSAADVQEILASTAGDVEVMVHLTSETPGTPANYSAEFEREHFGISCKFASYS